MKTYYVVYKSTTDGDCCTVWTKAKSAEEAKEQVRHEYWDIDRIISAYSKY